MHHNRDGPHRAERTTSFLWVRGPDCGAQGGTAVEKGPVGPIVIPAEQRSAVVHSCTIDTGKPIKLQK